MSDEPKDILDRRDFVIASLAAAGAPTALAGITRAANAEGAAVPDANPAPPPQQGTVHTGDVVKGKPVISALAVDDLEANRKHAFYFEGVQMPTGQHWYVSVMVAKGAKPGKRIALVSGVHGDEMSPVRTVQTVMGRLDPAEMSGAVLAVLDVSRPALEGMARRWPGSGRGIDLIDINRTFPGDENGASAAARHAGLVFDRLLRPNADYAIDFHTAATGMDMTAFPLARMDLPEVRAMAELFPIDQIFDNPAYPGLLANAFIAAGIPALTAEIGAPRRLDHGLIPLFVEGTMNVLKHHGVVPGPMGRTGRDTGIFVAGGAHAVLATHGGFVELLVDLNDKVEVGQKVAVQRDTFGEVVAEYASGVAGEVAARRTDATSEPGNPLVFILHDGAAREGAEAYPE
ncbi:MAG TPA: succinylglutamate desuccinylase/aspartoacylase family protein [Geminicoccaceae bacterium]|nr:succinylglutamate desuccinylase/aspartoacylase family protein [Geminicoccaceae bacterium]